MGETGVALPRRKELDRSPAPSFRGTAQLRSSPSPRRALAYDDTGGTGVPLVLLHGFPLDRTLWFAQLRGLAGAARVIAPDLRGFGESAGSAAVEATSMDIYAADVAGLLDSLDIATAVIGGVSMGGYVAMAFHRLFPERVRALLLVDTRSGPDSDEARAARDAASELVCSGGAAGLVSTESDTNLFPLWEISGAGTRPPGARSSR